jgi:hypothetical protein
MKLTKGMRIEIPVHYDWWMRGARYGVVTSIDNNRGCAYVKLDAVPTTHRARIWRIDWEYCKLVPRLDFVNNRGE